MLNVFVNTWGNYNENGAEGGEWLTLPMDETELEEKLDAIAEAMKDDDPEWAIHDWEYKGTLVGKHINENDDLFELNEYAQQLDDLDEYDLEKYSAIIEYFGSDYVTIDDLDDYQLYADIHNEYDLGYYWIVESGCYDLSSMGTLANYIDYEAFGRDINLEADGGFTSYGWVERC
jgi:antirestriction protein